MSLFDRDEVSGVWLSLCPEYVTSQVSTAISLEKFIYFISFYEDCMTVFHVALAICVEVYAIAVAFTVVYFV